MPMHTFAYLTALTGRGLAGGDAETSWKRGVGSWTHHDLGRAPGAASHLTIGARCPR